MFKSVQSAARVKGSEFTVKPVQSVNANCRESVCLLQSKIEAERLISLVGKNPSREAVPRPLPRLVDAVC